MLLVSVPAVASVALLGGNLHCKIEISVNILVFFQLEMRNIFFNQDRIIIEATP